MKHRKNGGIVAILIQVQGEGFMKHRALFGTAFSALAVAGLLACSETTTSTGQPPGTTPGTEQPGTTPTGEDPLAGLSADWKTKAAGYLDGRAQEWIDAPPPIANVKCAMSCHTTFPTLVARGALGVDIAAADNARTAFVGRVTEATAGEAVPFYGKGTNDPKIEESHATEAVLNAFSLAFDDLAKGGNLSGDTKDALEQMWTTQSADGSWAWLEFELEPWETRNDWGAAMAALLVGSIPEGATSGQAAGATKVKGYVQKNLSKMALHDQVTVLWASGAMKDLIEASDAEKIVTDLVAKQNADGGFALGSWGKGSLKSTKSDGYATALATLALCKGTAEGAARPEAVSGLKWLAANQAEDGSWPGKSVNTSSARAKGFMTDAATAYAALALTSCVKK